jgi:hypothetical protein
VCDDAAGFMSNPNPPRSLGVIRPYTAFLAILGLAACNSAAPRSNPSEEGTGGSDATGGKPATPTGGKSGGGTGGSATGGSVGTGGSDATGGSGTGGSTPPVDAGSTSSPDSGATPDGPPASSGGCSAKFCDDFESFAPGSKPAGMWTIHLEKGNLAVDETRAFSGTRSIKLTHPGAPAAMFLELKQPVLPLAGNVTYARFMYYITKTPTTTAYPHFELVRGTGPLPGGEQAQLNTGGEKGHVMINYEPGDCSLTSKVAMPDKKWICYQVRFDIPKNDIHEWIDNVEATDIPVKPGGGSCWKMPMAVDALHIGWESYHGESVELWIDDVAVDDKPIPCPTGMPSKP